ncbi:glycosyltransferase family 2 protein [Mangrovicella endophytica]|uniref:glycosyltransferase family 2 protein n=1 Tax=Mangrovicella endophytica TaxID=2066697 RepID=UPI000C9E426E|nr:glycosyltransferase family 2 protein [Mangrovicella endophytica]
MPLTSTGTMPPRDPRRILLAATMRNEGPFILEWVAYHRSIGFTDIVISSNDCIDASPALLDRLQALGLVTHLSSSFAPGEKPQLAAYARLEQLPVVAASDWAMVLDADEFLNIHVGSGRVTDLIDAVPEATGILVNWRIFGASGHETFEPGLVTERFTRAAPQGHGVNLSFKTLFRNIDAYACKLMPHQPRYPAAERLGAMHYVDGAGRTLPAYFFDESRDSFLQSEPGAVSFALAQVNHYNTRSAEDYRVKHHRGGGLNIDWVREDSWAVFNRNEEEDRSIAGKLPGMKAILEELFADDELRSLHEVCCRRYREHIAVLVQDGAASAAAERQPA